jgi:addiction module RelE/StbE family toxin
LALAVFVNKPHHPSLYNHPLTGQWVGHRSLSFGGDWRAHYLLKGNDMALFVAVGTHA